MPRPLTGRIRVKQVASGHDAYYAILRNVERLIGQEPQWSLPKAEKELENKILPLAKLGQPWWNNYGSVPLAAASSSTLSVHEAVQDLLVVKLTDYEGRYVDGEA